MNPNGIVVYEGPSRIDGQPIVVILTGLRGKSTNTKTGDMVQSWILRSDIAPTEALRTGGDVSICGGCVHRPKSHDGTGWKGRSCYVNVAQAPTVIWKTYRRGAYPTLSLQDASRHLTGRFLRLGAYGDPATVPLAVWRPLVDGADGHTGYAHQWKSKRLNDVLEFCQVSADSLKDSQHARRIGFGSFRVLPVGAAPAPWETVCPASEEAGRKTTCANCRLCTGASGAHIAIQAHGIGAQLYTPKGEK